MAYPTGMLSIVLEDIDRRIAALKFYAQQVRAECIAGNVPSSRILDVFINLQQERTALVTAAATPGLAQFAKDQKNNQTLDVVAEFNGVIAMLDGINSWLTTNFPKDASGFLLAKSFSGNTIIDRLFAPAQTSGFQVQLANLIATIT